MSHCCDFNDPTSTPAGGFYPALCQDTAQSRKGFVVQRNCRVVAEEPNHSHLTWVGSGHTNVLQVPRTVATET